MFDETRMGDDSPVTKIDDYHRLFAIGDIHGCRDELQVLIKNLINKENLTEMDMVVFIGDYVDRGPDSPGVIHDLVEMKRKFPRTQFLRGNHEDMFIAYLYDHYNEKTMEKRFNPFGAMFGHMFHYNGGDKTHQQYIPSMTLEEINQGDVKDHIALRNAMPKSHRRFLLETKHIIDTPDAYFVHAGFRNFKYTPLEEQPTGTTLWIRQPFLYGDCYFGKTVVHGHTPVDTLSWIDYGPNSGGSRADQINIDTGCAYHNTGRFNGDGRLTCLNVKEKYAFSVVKGEKKVKYHRPGELIKRQRDFIDYL